MIDVTCMFFTTAALVRDNGASYQLVPITLNNQFCYVISEMISRSQDKRWQCMSGISAFSWTVKCTEGGLDVELDKQHSRGSLCLSHRLFLKLEREGWGKQRREKFVGWISEERRQSKNGENGRRRTQTGRERRQERHRQKWASGGYLRVTGCCHHCTVLWVNCQNIDWSTWQPSPSSFSSKFYSCSLLLLPQKETSNTQPAARLP